ncbi:MAG: sensor histidine kinase [Lachnospiraceae bacterium]|nr:sensor histidine kinase [Lachnospiraceae bacterium]
MDTKLKNNRMAVRTAAAVVALASICFVFVAIGYKGDVDAYYAEYSGDYESESFIRILFQSNYVLYPEVLEKSGRQYKTEDLYLLFEEETADQAIYYGNEIHTERSAERLMADCIMGMQQHLQQINELYTTELGRRMDYCVIDEDTQTILKNTTRNPEYLQNGENKDYQYYIAIFYDQNGSIVDIKVNGRNADKFLKNAQLVANSQDSLLFTDSQKVENYALVTASYEVNGKMTITQQNPKNVTFIYAMTAEQMESFTWMPVYQFSEYDALEITHYIGGYSKEMAYSMFGIGRVYLSILGVITIIFFVLSRSMPHRTADTAGTRYCAELILMIQFFLSFSIHTPVVELVCYINESAGNIRFPLDFWYVVSYVILFGVMFVLFGTWYWCLLSIRSIFRGLHSFVRERSFLYRKYIQLKDFFGKICDRWSKELSETDLGKNNKRLLKALVIVQFVVVSFICCCWFFGILILIVYSYLLYVLLKLYIGRVQRQYNNLIQATNAIAQGKFDNDFKSNFGIFESYKKELLQIQDGFGKAVEEEVRSQHMKTELITNVSHDLKTPLTAIITYIDLLKDENITDEQRKSYLDTLERKSLRLKVLIEDLFEISKASSGNVKLEPVSVNICNLMRQVYLEHEEKMLENGLDVRFDMPEEKVILQLDSQKTYRIFENLYVNIIKYAMANTRVYIQVKREEDVQGRYVHIEIKNISTEELTVNPMDLTERFVRGDISRNTEGSGLGLAIAKSFTQLQGGMFEIGIDGDLFKVIIEWREF